MKKLLFFLIVLASSATNFSCKKSPESPPLIPIDTTNFKEIPEIKNYTSLIEMPLDTVKKYIKGKWKINSKQGGIALFYYDYDNTYAEFIFNNTTNDTIKWYDNNIYYANGIANYDRIAFGMDSIYIISFIQLPNYPWYWYAERANNDSLYIKDGFVDGFTYFLTKVR
jgi:hypothetical protein